MLLFLLIVANCYSLIVSEREADSIGDPDQIRFVMIFVLLSEKNGDSGSEIQNEEKLLIVFSLIILQLKF